MTCWKLLVFFPPDFLFILWGYIFRCQLCYEDNYDKDHEDGKDVEDGEDGKDVEDGKDGKDNEINEYENYDPNGVSGMCKENEEFQADFDHGLRDLFDQQIDDDYMAVDGHFNASCCNFSLLYYYITNKIPSVTEDAEDGPPAHDTYGMHAGCYKHDAQLYDTYRSH